MKAVFACGNCKALRFVEPGEALPIAGCPLAPSDYHAWTYQHAASGCIVRVVAGHDCSEPVIAKGMCATHLQMHVDTLNRQIEVQEARLRVAKEQRETYASALATAKLKAG